MLSFYMRTWRIYNRLINVVGKVEMLNAFFKVMTNIKTNQCLMPNER